MKKMIISDLSTNDVREKIKEEKNLYTKLKLNHAISPVENPLKIRSTRKNIARLMTELTKRLAETQSEKEQAS
jgi:large subunit ribosomal protein L29